MTAESLRGLKGIRSLHNVLCSCPDYRASNVQQVPGFLAFLEAPNLLTVVNLRQSGAGILAKNVITVEENEDPASLAWSDDGQVCIVSTNTRIVVLSWTKGVLAIVHETKSRYRLQQVDIVSAKSLSGSVTNKTYLICIACSAGALIQQLCKIEDAWQLKPILDTNQCVLNNPLHYTWPVSCVQFSKCGNHLALGLYSGTISIWNISDEQIVQNAQYSTDKNERITSIGFSPCSFYLAAIDWCGALFVYRSQARDSSDSWSCFGQIATGFAAESTVPLLCWMPRGNVFLVAGHDGIKAFHVDGLWLQPLEVPLFKGQSAFPKDDGINGIAMASNMDQKAEIVIFRPKSGFHLCPWPFQIYMHSPILSTSSFIVKVVQDERFLNGNDFDYSSDSASIKLLVCESKNMGDLELDLDFLSTSRFDSHVSSLESSIISSNRQNVYISALVNHIVVYNNQVLYLRELSHDSSWTSVIIDNPVKALAIDKNGCGVFDDSGLFRIIDHNGSCLFVTDSLGKIHEDSTLCRLASHSTNGLDEDDSAKFSFLFRREAQARLYIVVLHASKADGTSSCFRAEIPSGFEIKRVELCGLEDEKSSLFVQNSSETLSLKMERMYI